MPLIEPGRKAPAFALKDQSGRTDGVSFPLLADADHAVAEKYGVWQQKSRYGRKYMGIARTTYLIDAEGKIARRWDNVKVAGHVADVHDALSSLSS